MDACAAKVGVWLAGWAGRWAGWVGCKGAPEWGWAQCARGDHHARPIRGPTALPPRPTSSHPNLRLQQAHFQAARCLYMAHSLLAAGQHTEAAGLFGRAGERCKQAARCGRGQGAPHGPLPACWARIFEPRTVSHTPLLHSYPAAATRIAPSRMCPRGSTWRRCSRRRPRGRAWQPRSCARQSCGRAPRRARAWRGCGSKRTRPRRVRWL